MPPRARSSKSATKLQPIPGVWTQIDPGPVEKVFELTAAARDVAARLSKNGRMLVVSRGQFSLLDLVHAALERTGPASVMFTSWSTGLNDAKQMAWLLREGHIRSLRFFSGNGFAERHGDYVRQMREMFGDGCVVTAELHAKIAVVINEEWAICIRSSCNLNRNPRIEQFDVDDSRDMAEWLIGWSEQLAQRGVAGWIPEDREVARTALREWGGKWEERPANMPIAERGAPPSVAVEGESAHLRTLRERVEGVAADIRRVRAEGRDPGRLLEEERIAGGEYRRAAEDEQARVEGEVAIERARRLLRYAVEAGSMGAVATLERRVADMERAAHDAEEERRRRAPDGDRLAMLIEAVLSLPLDMRTQVEAAIRDQRPGLH